MILGLKRNQSYFYYPYHKLFRQSLKLGLIVIPCCLNFNRDHIKWDKIIPVLRDKNLKSIN